MVYVFNKNKAVEYPVMKLSYQNRMWCTVDVTINGTAQSSYWRSQPVVVLIDQTRRLQKRPKVERNAQRAVGLPQRKAHMLEGAL